VFALMRRNMPWQEMARHGVGPRRTDSLRTYVRATRIIGALSVLVLSGAIVWDLANDGFWSRHALFTALVANLIVVAVTAAVLNEVLERRQRERVGNHHIGCLCQLVCGEGFALRGNGLGALLALGLSLASHRALHAVGQLDIPVLAS
jgi:hypothetical protein